MLSQAEDGDSLTKFQSFMRSVILGNRSKSVVAFWRQLIALTFFYVVCFHSLLTYYTPLFGVVLYKHVNFIRWDNLIQFWSILFNGILERERLTALLSHINGMYILLKMWQVTMCRNKKQLNVLRFCLWIKLSRLSTDKNGIKWAFV